MAYQYATAPPEDPLNEHLHSTFALDLFTQVAATRSADAFVRIVTTIFGTDIGPDTCLQFREDLLAGRIASPPIIVTAGGPVADYDNRERVIRIDRKAVSLALDDAHDTTLLDILLHESGHHVDNVLRRDVHPRAGGNRQSAPDAPGEEGVRFSFWMAVLGQTSSPRVTIARYRLRPGQEMFDVQMDWDMARMRIIEKCRADYDRPDAAHVHPDREAFEAGDGDGGKMTHLQIEEVLKPFGFRDVELEAIYFGNWLRDYSQLLDPKIVRAASMPKNFPDVLSRDALTRIVDVLSIKRFNWLRHNSAHLFTVTPDKLGVYRPSEHIDNPKTIDTRAPDPTTRDPDFEPLVMPGSPLLEVDYDTSMKRYIGRSVSFMQSELRIAMTEKKNAQGLRAFGSALHVLEDFFAHSNFVELGLIKAGHEAVVPWTSPADCKAGLPLVTGMFGATDVLASVAGPLGEVLFSTEDVTYQPLKPEERSPREQILMILLEEHHNPRYLEIFKAYLDTRDEWVGLPFVEFLQRCALYLQGPAVVVGNAVGIVMTDMLKQFGERVDDWQTRYGQDPHDNGSTDPTHSQLAKDHTEHPLHLLAGSLASHAVGQVAAAMVAYWEGDSSADPVRVASAYFCHPQNSHWQDAEIAAWANANPEDLRRSQSKTELFEIYKAICGARRAAVDQMGKDGKAYLMFLRGELLDKNSPLWIINSLTPAGKLTRDVLKYLKLI